VAVGVQLDERIQRKQPVLHQLLLDTQEGREVLALVREARAVIVVAGAFTEGSRRQASDFCERRNGDHVQAARERGEDPR